MTKDFPTSISSLKKLETIAQLEAAFSRIATCQPEEDLQSVRLTASTLAKEAGIDRATIYRSYPEFIAKIQEYNSAYKLKSVTEREKEYRKLVEEAQHQVSCLANINYRLKTREDALEKRIQEQDQMIATLRKKLYEFENPVTLQRLK